MGEDCVFCKIIKGEIPSYTVYEDDDFKVILDRYPASPGHMLVMPKMHIENVYELNDELAPNLMRIVKNMAINLKEGLNPDGINVLQNNGEAAGQTVMHYHTHIIPRYKGSDGVSVGWKNTDTQISELLEVYNRLKEEI